MEKEGIMKIRDIPNSVVAIEAGVDRHNHSHRGHAHVWQHAMSRRQFMRKAAGVAAVGTVLGAGVLRPGQAKAHQAHEPVPIPGGTPVFGGYFHVFGPGFPDFDPPDAEPSTITDFNGFLGLAYISGQVTRTNMATGEVRMLPFVNNDMRFMKGNFRGTDGRMHHGAFAFI
jgi:hypothetical protein